MKDQYGWDKNMAARPMNGEVLEFCDQVGNVWLDVSYSDVPYFLAGVGGYHAAVWWREIKRPVDFVPE